MSAINSFFSNANAALYVDTLFSTRQASTSSSSTASTGHAYGGTFDPGAETAGQRALGRIIEILTLGGDTKPETADVEQQLGYVTAGSGTEGDDTMTVTGRAIYNLDTGAGNDTLTLKSAAIAGVASGAGKDVIKAAGEFVGEIDGGDGDDDIQLKASLALDIRGGAGNDTIKVSADTIRGLDGGDGDDRLTLEGNRIFATGGAGNDTVDIKTTGRDAVVEYAFGRGGGQDSVTSSGKLSIDLGGLTAKDLTLSVSGNSLTASIAGSDDKITVTLTGSSSAGADATPAYRFTTRDGKTMLDIG